MPRKVFSTHIRTKANKQSAIRCSPPAQWHGRDELPSISPSQVSSFKPRDVTVTVTTGKGKAAKERKVAKHTELCGRCMSHYEKEQRTASASE